MNTISKFWKIIVAPQRTALELARENSIRSSLSVVLSLGFVLALMNLASALAHDFPPPADEFQTWIDAYGEFAMLPFLNIPPEHYRLAQAIFAIPLVLALWILMAGSAKLLSILFGGKVSYDQYLNLLCFSFFTFWILAGVIDTAINLLSGDYMLSSLRGEHGVFARGFYVYSFSINWTVLLTVGGVYNGLVSYFTEKFAAWKAVVIGMVTMAWPIVLTSLLLR
jgi:hypothetical protein